jgi:hypothetical protein
MWPLREPDAVTIVQNGNLRMGVRRFTRSHDRVQFLDNGKHVLFSTKTFDVPPGGDISFSVTMSAQGRDCAAGDLYDGFASFLCLDFSTGTAIDLFCRDDMCAAVFARLPFPGVEVPDLEPLKYWAIFDEHPVEPGPHDYRITIRPSARSITWSADGTLVREQKMPDYELGPLMLGLGLMTEKNIVDGRSVSCHGQGISAEWSPIRVE